MSRFVYICGLLCTVVFPLCAQNWTVQDSLRLQRLLKGDGEIRLNPKALKELEMNTYGVPKASIDKHWLDYDTTLPSSLSGDSLKKLNMTLYPYKPTTKYNWDPIYQKKINVDKNTWRGDEFYELKTLTIPTNWAKRPLDAGPRESVEQIEATGMRYRVTERANNMAVGGWNPIRSAPSGLDFMKIFTRDFWSFKGRKRRARTEEMLKAYGDSIAVGEKTGNISK